MWKKAENNFFSNDPIPPNEIPVRRIRTGFQTGGKILFFSDTHFKGEETQSFFAGNSLSSWVGTQTIFRLLKEAAEREKPEIILFGGDLCSYSGLYPETFRQMKELYPAAVRLAIPGNWDERRKKWFPMSRLSKMYEDCGWIFLRNEGISIGKRYFYGMDDYKLGKPEWNGVLPEDTDFACLAAHNPDAVALLPDAAVQKFQLVLCGHTHGGQIRVPGFGAVKTSSVHWKKFEYGKYRNGNTQMYVTSGIGTTALPKRFFCPPEILIMEP